MSRRDLLAYWPTLESLADCLKVDAESASKAVSLAVHQPMRFVPKVIGSEGRQLDECDERALLDAFLAPTLADGRVILPIVGSSGSGKSHAIRWLDTQIEGMPGRRVVIRVPKGLSLKGVLKLLLDSLKGPAYEPYRKELEVAQEKLDPTEAAGLLCETLAQTLINMFEETRENRDGSHAKECEAVCRPEVLPTLLRNQLLRDQHFVRTPTGGDGVAKKLVEHLTETRSAGEDDDRKHFFTIDDLNFDGVDTGLLGRAELGALSRFDGREDRCLLAVKYLNLALEPAKARLIKLDPTVSDLFDAVRRELHKDKKELVLLIEDFAVLSGLQKQLLQVMIKEAFRDGEQVLCTMRTALAYTSGYLDTATVLSRAGVEYHIPDSSGSDQEILDRVVRQVGAYLNAARVGQKALDKAYKVQSSHIDELGNWVPRFDANVEPDVRDTLKSFGRTEDGYELFPFNLPAVHELAREGCVEAGRLVYNPRLVIKNVLDRVLRDRPLYESGDFPSAESAHPGRALEARVQEHVDRQVPSGEARRYRRFLSYWGGRPDSVPEIASVDERVFAAFGLDKKLVAGRAGTQPKVHSPAPLTPQPEARPVLDSREAKWRTALEEWRNGETLKSQDANQLRRWIWEALQGSIDFDWDLFRPGKDLPMDKLFQLIYFPRAAGGEASEPDQAMVEVCTEKELESESDSARIHGALMAVVRFHYIHQSWDFPEADESLPRYVALVETLSQRARDYVRRRYFKLLWDPLPTLVQGLLVGARALGIEGANRDTHQLALLKAILSPAPEVLPTIPAAATDAGLNSWNAFVQQLSQCRSGAQSDGTRSLSWRDHLLNIVGARQGGAERVHAIDVLRLKPALEQAVSSWNIDTVSGTTTGAVEFVHVKAVAQELRRHSAGIEKARAYFVAWHERLSSWFGDDFDKNDLVLELLDTVEAIREAGLHSGVSATECKRLVERFRDARVKEALGDAARLIDDASRGSVLTVLGRGHGSVAKLCDDLKEHLELLLSTAEFQIRNEAITSGETPLQGAFTMLSSELEETSKRLEELKSYGTA